MKEHGQRIIEEAIREGESLKVEFKSSIDLKSKNSRRSLARLIAGFANAQGGIIVVGVAEENGQVVPMGINPDLFDKKEISIIVGSYLAPEVEFTSELVSIEDKQLGIITVKKSKKPVVIAPGDSIPVRIGAHTNELNTSEGYQQLIQRRELDKAIIIILASIGLLICITVFLAEVIASFDQMFGILTSITAITSLLASLTKIRIGELVKGSGAIEIVHRHRTAIRKGGFAIIATLVIIAEFSVAVFWLSLTTSMLLFIAISNILVYILLGTIGMVPTDARVQWGGLFGIVLLFGLGLVYMPESTTMTSLSVQMTGVFIGIMGGIALSETWKAFEEKRKSSDLIMRVVDEIGRIQKLILSNNASEITWPVWHSILSSENLLLIQRKDFNTILSAYKQIENYNSNRTPESKDAALEAIGKVLGQKY